MSLVDKLLLWFVVYPLAGLTIITALVFLFSALYLNDKEKEKKVENETLSQGAPHRRRRRTSSL